MTRLLSLASAIIMLMVVACTHRQEYSDVPDGASAYYWKTVFRLDSAERSFIKDNEIRRLYIRMFDVALTDGRIMPNATIAPKEQLPEGVDYVPVVFIVNEVMRRDSAVRMAERILHRVKAMARTHDWPEPKELQIDCDWSGQTAKTFHTFMREMHRLTQAEGMKLSATIRLHQLAAEPPAADYGVLMVYNTGDINNPSKGNPILSMRSVEPYLRHVGDYDLPLVAAYPSFRWPVLYAPGEAGGYQFRAILYGCRPDSEPDLFRKISDNEWIVISARKVATSAGNAEGLVSVTPGMKLYMFQSPPFGELMQIKRELAQRNKMINKSVIIFDLNGYNYNLYSKDEYKEIFNP